MAGHYSDLRGYLPLDSYAVEEGRVGETSGIRDGVCEGSRGNAGIDRRPSAAGGSEGCTAFNVLPG